MHIESHGAHGQDVVFLHGAPQDPADLSRLATPLADAYRVHVVHMPGYGRSAPPATPYSLSSVLGDLEDQLLAEGITEPALVGMSGGCYRALSMALRGRVAVTRLVGLGPLAFLDEANAAAIRGFADAVEAGADVGRAGAERAFGEPYRRAHPEAVDVVVDAFDAVSPALLAAELRAFADAEDLRPRLPQLRCPTLLRVGALDAATPPGHAQELAELIAGAELQVVPGVGHMLTYEDLEGTARALRSFLGA